MLIIASTTLRLGSPDLQSQLQRLTGKQLLLVRCLDGGVYFAASYWRLVQYGKPNGSLINQQRGCSMRLSSRALLAGAVELNHTRIHVRINGFNRAACVQVLY